MAIKTIGSLWAKTEKDKDKKHVLSGNLQMDGKDGEKIRIYIYKNEKIVDRGPEYRICIIEKDENSPQYAKKSSLPDF